MKKCSYCGKEYPDAATTCEIDGQRLIDPARERKKITGVWRGVFGYGGHKEQAALKPVTFTLKLKQGWAEHFDGSVMEDGPEKTPGTGTIDGYFKQPEIEFIKQMPVSYMTGQDGVRRTTREILLAQGHACKEELTGPRILYRGTLIDANRLQGTWIINPRRISLPHGGGFTTGRASGFWCAQFVTDNLASDPTGGPAEALFDKSLLSPLELAEGDGADLSSLGKFNVLEAEKILNRLEQENLRFDVGRDDAPIRQMNPLTSFFGGHFGAAQMIEIFIHPEDMPRAEAIIREGENPQAGAIR